MGGQMNFTQLKCFLEIVRTGNFSVASENLFISQSTVSKNILTLEKELDLRLFERKGRRAELTPEGLKLTKVFGEIVRNHDAAEHIVRAIKAEKANVNKTVKIAGIPVLGNLGILAALNTYTSMVPDVEFILDIMEEEDVILSLQSGECDMAFCSSLKLHPDYYETRKFSTQHFRVYVSPDNLLARREGVQIKDLSEFKLILPEPSSMLWEFFVTSCEAAGFTPDIIMAVNRPDVAFNYLKNSNYVYVGLDLLTREELPSSCRVVALEDSPELDYVFAWKKINAHTRALLRYLEEQFHL